MRWHSSFGPAAGTKQRLIVTAPHSNHLSAMHNMLNRSGACQQRIAQDLSSQRTAAQMPLGLLKPSLLPSFQPEVYACAVYTPLTRCRVVLATNGTVCTSAAICGRPGGSANRGGELDATTTNPSSPATCAQVNHICLEHAQVLLTLHGHQLCMVNHLCL